MSAEEEHEELEEEEEHEELQAEEEHEELEELEELEARHAVGMSLPQAEAEAEADEELEEEEAEEEHEELEAEEEHEEHCASPRSSAGYCSVEHLVHRLLDEPSPCREEAVAQRATRAAVRRQRRGRGRPRLLRVLQRPELAAHEYVHVHLLLAALHADSMLQREHCASPRSSAGSMSTTTLGCELGAAADAALAPHAPQRRVGRAVGQHRLIRRLDHHEARPALAEELALDLVREV